MTKLDYLYSSALISSIPQSSLTYLTPLTASSIIYVSMSPPDKSQTESFPWHLGVFDAHCHPTDTMGTVETIPSMKAKAVTVMATRSQDQHLVADVAQKFGIRSRNVDSDGNVDGHIVPCFGWHPWFSYQMYDDTEKNGGHEISAQDKIDHYKSALTPYPEDSDYINSLAKPLSFTEFLAKTKEYLEKFPYALIGEVGLDKSFRIPEEWTPETEATKDKNHTPGSRDGRHLTPYRVSMEHQRKIVLAQLKLAAEMNRPVSVHGVAAHGYLYNTLESTWKGHEKPAINKKESKLLRGVKNLPDEQSASPPNPHTTSPPYPPRICLHSYSGTAETLKQYFHASVPIDFYVSFSSAINMSKSTKSVDVIKYVRDDRILVESDLHIAGNEMDRRLEEMTRMICEIRGWSLEEGVLQLGRNWKRFIFGEEI